MTGSELRDLLAAALARSAGGGPLRWRRALGEVRVYPRATHAHCNWDVRPIGTPREVEAVERAADAIRLRHPFVDEDR